MKSRLVFAAPAVLSLAAVACSAEVGSSSASESTGAAAEALTCSALWGQCGGSGWTGATCCAFGSTCRYANAGYSQCLPSWGGSSSSTSTRSSSNSSSASTATSTTTSTTTSSTASSSADANCPAVGANDAQMRAAATAAFQILKAASAACGNEGMQPCWGTSMLSSQHYRVASTGTSIEFDPNTQVYPFVSNAEKAALAIAQLDSSTAAFLVSALQWDQATTNGANFAYLPATAALSAYTYPGDSTPIPVTDPNAGGAPPGARRKEVVTGSSWCGATRVHFVDTSTQEIQFAPAEVQSWNNLFGSSSKYHGSGNNPASPFNGANSQNPYLVISGTVNGAALNWSDSTWPTMDCAGSVVCNGTLDIDPIPYTQPGDQYDANGNAVGAQANPFQLVITNLYADPSHQNQWATRTLNGVQQWGTFSLAINVLGTTVYQYVKQM